MSGLATFIGSVVLLVVMVRWVLQWRAQPAAVGAAGVARKVALGWSDRDTIGLAAAVGVMGMSWLSARLVELVAWLAAGTGLDAQKLAPAGADIVVLALIAVAVLDGVLVGLCDTAPRWLQRLFDRIGAVLAPALRHTIYGLLLPAVVLAGMPLLAQTGSDAIAAARDIPTPAVCAPAELAGDTIAGYGPQQLANAAVIVQVGQEMGVPERGQVIAVATAMQESALRGDAVGDHGSAFGLFQQRPVSGWGTREEVTDPRTAARKFYDRLLKVRGWAGLPLWQAAQTVQRSAFPTAYAKNEPAAAQVLGAVRGLTCTEIRS